jgi:signal transduction histidine kinase
MSHAVLPPSSGGSTVRYPWLLPGALTLQAEDRDGPPPRRRSLRDWLVDTVFFLIAVAAVFCLPLESSGPGIRLSGPLAWCAWVLGGAGCLALWLRRRWPAGVALACAPLGVLVLPTPATSTILAVFTVAVHRPARTAVLVTAPILVTAPLYFVVHPNSVYRPASLNIVASIVTAAGALGWGMLVRSRRQMLTSLRERAQRAEHEQQLRVEQARRAERTRLAHETHDVLARRISLIGRHADALQYRTDATADELTRAAGLIRANAHQALQELREAIGLLRARPARSARGPDRQATQARPRAEPGDAAPPPAHRLRGSHDGLHRLMRTVLPWFIDAALVVASALLVAVHLRAPADLWVSEPLRRADLAFGVLACLLLRLRRRWPVAVAVACVPLGMFVFSTGLAAALVALFTAASRRGPRPALLLGALAVFLAPVFLLVRPDRGPGSAELINLPVGITLTAAVLSWGMLVRARRQLVDVLRERAVRAHEEQQLRTQQARWDERTRLAREMHDVLGHRISLVSLHAGALEYGTDITAEEIAAAAEVIRTNAQLAGRELREVIDLLDDAPADPDGPGRPQPRLADVNELVAQSAAAGNPVHFTSTITDPEAVPATAGRTVYRLAQEALTNARKHVPGADVHLALAGVPGWLHLRVTNPLPTTPPAGPRAPGSGTGLIGLAERVALADGYLTHGPTPNGTFHLEAWIPSQP